MPNFIRKSAIIALLLLAATPAFALEIKDYPTVPGLVAPSENCTGPDCLGLYVSYWVGLLIYAAGSLALISLVIGGIQLIMSGTGEDPMGAGNAKDRIKGAVLGLVLTMSSFIILKTINPALITPILTPLPGVAGVFYTNGTEEKPTPIAESNTINIPQGFNRIFYKCSETGGGTGPTLLIWKFPKINFQGNDDNYDGVMVARKKCGEKETLSDTGSFKIAFETAGVYYFLKEDCSGLMSEVNLSNQQKISEPFNDKIKSIRIVNNAANNNFFGFVAHEAPDFRGRCDTLRYLSIAGDLCIKVNVEASSMNIFQWNGFGQNWKTSGSGLVFYSNPFGYKTGSKAGFFTLSKEDIKGFWTGDPKNMVFNYEGVDVSEEEYLFCEDFEICSGSIKIQGNYLLVFYSTPQSDQCPPGQCLNVRNVCVPEPNEFCAPGPYGAQYCQTFYKDVENLKNEEVSAEGKKIDWVHILPIK